MAITPTPIKQQVRAPNNPANYNSTVSTTPGLTGTSAVMEPAGATPADWGASANVGVFGFGTTGVQGNGATGVQGASVENNGIGVQGTSSGQGGIGVEATSQGGHAIQASSTADIDAVLVTSSSPNHAAVSATNTGGGYGFWASSTGAAVFGSSTNGMGIVGVSQTQDAINGTSASAEHAGVSGTNTNAGYGVWGFSQNGIGMYAKGAKYAAQLDGALQVNGDGTITGSLTVADVVLSNAADFAEDFDVGSVAAAEPGTVMVLDKSGGVQPAECAYDRKVVGIVSGAGDYKPGIILDRRVSSRERRAVALVGKVFCKVDARYGPVAIGDLLTTSPTRGYAMKATDASRSFGAVIGKALRSQTEGQGLIPILVALQ
jgi:hypothetical protein